MSDTTLSLAAHGKPGIMSQVWDMARKLAPLIAAGLAVWLGWLAWQAGVVGTKAAVMDALTAAFMAVLDSCIILAGWLVFRREADWRDMVLFCLIGTRLDASGLFSEVLPEAMFVVYGWLTGHFITSLRAMEFIPKFTFFILFALGLLWHVLKGGAGRTLDRTLFLVVSTAMISVTALFHFILFDFNMHGEKRTRFETLEALLMIEDPAVMQQSCARLGVVCAERKAGDETLLLPESESILFQKRMEYIYANPSPDLLPRGYKPDYDISVTTPWEADDFVGPKGAEYTYLAVLKRQPDGQTFRIAMDRTWQEVLERAQVVILTLALVAFTTWSSGALLLSHMHKKRKLRSVRIQRSEPARMREA